MSQLNGVSEIAEKFRFIFFQFIAFFIVYFWSLMDLEYEWIFWRELCHFLGFLFVYVFEKCSIIMFQQMFMRLRQWNVVGCAIIDVGLMSKIDMIEWIFLSTCQRPETKKLINKFSFHIWTCDEDAEQVTGFCERSHFTTFHQKKQLLEMQNGRVWLRWMFDKL